MTVFFRWIVHNPLIANLMTFCILLGGGSAVASAPSPLKPSLQVHVKPPSVLVALM